MMNDFIRRGARRSRGFSVLEIIIVVLCLCILLLPIMRIFRTGARSSLQGMLQLETTMEARRVLSQVYLDLKSACFEMKGAEMTFAWKTLMPESPVAMPYGSYRFLRFPNRGRLEDCFSGAVAGASFRRASEIEYRISRHPTAAGLKILTRIERFHPDHPEAARHRGGIQTTVLSERVNLFMIEQEPLQSGPYSLLAAKVTLQLFDSLRPRERDTPNVGITRPREGAVADFVEIVYPEFYRSLLNRSWFNLNWQTGIDGPN